MVRILRGIVTALRARSKVFWGVTAGVTVFNLAAPVLILSLVKRPVDFFTFNPWLKRLPEYLAEGNISLGKKLRFLSQMAIGWFSADNGGEGIDWGFIIDVPSLARILATALLFGAYFALWSYRRSQVQAGGPGMRVARPAGLAGAATTMFGLTTGPCTLAGCGSPVLPVIGLAFTGLSS